MLNFIRSAATTTLANQSSAYGVLKRVNSGRLTVIMNGLR